MTTPSEASAELALDDRVEFALRDAGFDYDEAFRIGKLALSSHGGGGEAVAFRYLARLSGTTYARTRWVGMDEFHHYDEQGNLTPGAHPDWQQVEFAYGVPQPRAEGMVLDAARAFVAKLEAVHGDSEYEAVWTIAQLHRGAYRGPTYTAEFDALKAALAAAPGEGSAAQMTEDTMPARDGAPETRFVDGMGWVVRCCEAGRYIDTLRAYARRELETLDTPPPASQSATPSDELPELPACWTYEHPVRLYTADQMRAYGQLCRNGGRS